MITAADSGTVPPRDKKPHVRTKDRVQRKPVLLLRWIVLRELAVELADQAADFLRSGGYPLNDNNFIQCKDLIHMEPS